MSKQTQGKIFSLLHLYSKGNLRFNNYFRSFTVKPSVITNGERIVIAVQREKTSIALPNMWPIMFN